MPPRRSAADAINARFRNGRPSNDPNEFGVLVHVIDGSEDRQEPWLPSATLGLVRVARDRLPASLIYAGLDRIWTDPGCTRACLRFNGTIPMPLGDGLRGGYVLRPTADQVRCAFPRDGGSRFKPDGCACKQMSLKQMNASAEVDDCNRWCEPKTANATGRWRWILGQGEINSDSSMEQLKLLGSELNCHHLPYRPMDLTEMLVRSERTPGRTPMDGRNAMEVVVSPTRWNHSFERRLADWRSTMPGLIQAFWYPATARGDCCAGERCYPACRDAIAALHQMFLAAHGLNETDVPLLELRRDRWSRPFSQVASVAS